MSQMALLSLLVTTARGSRAIAAEGTPQALEGDVKAAVMQAFRKAADKGKVWRVMPCSAGHHPRVEHIQLMVHALLRSWHIPAPLQLYGHSDVADEPLQSRNPRQRSPHATQIPTAAHAGASVIAACFP